LWHFDIFCFWTGFTFCAIGLVQKNKLAVVLLLLLLLGVRCP